MKQIMRYLRSFGIVGALCLAPFGQAQSLSETSWLDDFQFHGFVAQSYLHSDHNNFFGDSEDGSFEFQEFGVNTLWRPTAKLQFAAQWVARDAGKTDDGDLRFDYAFVDYALFNSSTGSSGVRVGRIVNPYGFYNDTRDIAATRPSILLPQSVYFDVNRNFALSSDGVQFYHQFGGESGDFNLQFGITEPRLEDPDFKPALFFTSVPGDLEGTTSWMGRLLYEYDLGRIRFGLTAGEVNVEYKPGAGDIFEAGDFQLRPYIVSAQYNTVRWSFVFEYVKRVLELKDFGPWKPDTKTTGRGYFLQGSYRIGRSYELFLRYDDLVWDKDDSDGEKFAQAAAALGLPAHMRFAEDWTFGGKWDVNRYLMLRAEWHKVNGTGWLSRLENPDPAETREDWDLFTVSISARF